MDCVIIYKIEYEYICQEHAFGSVVCEMVAILFRPQYQICWEAVTAAGLCQHHSNWYRTFIYQINSLSMILVKKTQKTWKITNGHRLCVPTSTFIKDPQRICFRWKFIITKPLESNRTNICWTFVTTAVRSRRMIHHSIPTTTNKSPLNDEYNWSKDLIFFDVCTCILIGCEYQIHVTQWSFGINVPTHSYWSLRSESLTTVWFLWWEFLSLEIWSSYWYGTQE